MVDETQGGSIVTHHVFDPDTGQPLVTQYGLSSHLFLSRDERGSVMASTGNAGSLLYGNPYDEFGRPMPWSTFRYLYTGQAWLNELGLSYYKARMYSPKLGRFLQTDPIGYDAGPNLYAYVSNDPVNLIDPLGLDGGRQPGTVTPYCPDPSGCSPVVVTGSLLFAVLSWATPTQFFAFSFGALSSRSGGGGGGGGGGGHAPAPPPKPKPKPKYCSSIGYKIGDFIDKNIGGGLKGLGTGTVGAGIGVGLATAVTGFGAGAGGAIMATGGAIYAGGTAVSTVGNGVKWLSGQDSGVTIAGLASFPTMTLGPISQIVADQSISYFMGKGVPNPCDK